MSFAPGASSGAPDVARAVLRPVREGDAFEAVVEHLATAIRLGAFVRGQSLPPERELAARLGVARVTLREAMAALRDARMIETRPGRGGGSVVVYDGADLREVAAPEGGTVTVDDLVAKGAVRKNQPVKVLGQGDLSVKVEVSANAFSASAKEKIEAAGGTTTVI